MPRRLTLEQVNTLFIQEGYVLLATAYKNAHIKLPFICPKGHKHSITWNKFKSGHRCAQCAGFVEPKIKIKFIRQFFKKEGYHLLSGVYKNCHSKIEFLCPNGHTGAIRWMDFKQGHRCAECAGFIDPRIKIEQVRTHFAEHGYVLLSTKYVNAHAYLQFVCDRGHKNYISWTNFYNLGHGCSKCQESRGERQLGEILATLFPQKVKGQDNLDFLGRMTVDYSVRNLQLAFEYDGQHHFEPTRYGGMNQKQAEKNFKLQQQRDERKNHLCCEKNYQLIRIAYYENLSQELVEERVNQCLK